MTTSNMWLAVLLVLGRACLLAGQKAELPPSPCPSVFSYEGRSPEPDRWYGVVLVTTDSPLTGMRLDIKLNHPAQLLGNWEGEVTTSDNKRFIILNLDKKIVPGPPISVRIFVRYAEDRAIPVVDMIALNGKQICPSPQAGFNNRPPPQTSETNSVWHPPGLETSLEPAEPLEIDSTYQVSISRPDYNSYDDRTTKRPGTNKRPSDGYDSSYDDRTKRPSNDFQNSQTTRRPSGGTYDSDFQNPTGNKQSGGSYGNTDYENSSPPRRPTGNYDNEFQNPSPPRQPSYGSEDSQNRQTTRRPGGNNDNSDYETPSRPNNNGFQNSATTKRPSNTYDNTNYENQSPPRRPSNNFGNNGYEGLTTKRPTNNYDNTYNENESPPRRPTDNYGSNEFQNSQTTHRPSNNEYQTTTRRSAGNHGSENTDYHGTSNNNNNGYQSSGTTRKPSSNSQTTKRPTTTSTTRRPGYPEDNRRPGQDEVTRQPTTLSIASGSGGNRRPPDREVDSSTRGPQPQRTTKRPDREQPSFGSSDNERVECGKLHISAAPLVTNGQNTARGQWPWHAALYKAKGINLTYICGGTLVSPTAIVTAAHCVTKMIGNWPVDPDSLVIYLGKYHLKLWSEGGVQNKQVAEVHVHPQYNSSDFRSDVAVLVLSSPADFTEFVRPVCLWGNGNTDLRDIEGHVGYVVGWGYDEENRVTEQLMMARMPIVSQQTCLWSYPEFFSHFTNNRTYCAGFNNGSVPGTSVCNGDSGGGMVLPEEQRDGSKIWRLRGLVSISVSKEEKRVCDTKHYVVFTDLAKYQDWIEQYIN